MRSVFVAAVIGFCVSGCNTMTVGNTDGVKEMLGSRSRVVLMNRRVDDAAPANKQQLAEKYLEVCAESNSWIDGLMFDLDTRKAFSVTVADYQASPAASLADRYLGLAAVSVSSARAMQPGIDVAPRETASTAGPPVAAGPVAGAGMAGDAQAIPAPIAMTAPVVATATASPPPSAPATAAANPTLSIGSLSLAFLNLATGATTAEVAVALATLANDVTNNIMVQNDVAVAAARSRIHGALERAKWDGCE